MQLEAAGYTAGVLISTGPAGLIELTWPAAAWLATRGCGRGPVAGVRAFGVVVAEIAFPFQAEVEPGLISRCRPR